MHPVIVLLLSSITTDWVWFLIFTRFLDHTQRRTTVGKTPLNEWSVRRRDLYLTTHNNHNRQTSLPPTCWGILFTLKNPKASVGFEPANLGTKGQHATSRPPKPLQTVLGTTFCALWGLSCSGVVLSWRGHGKARRWTDSSRSSSNTQQDSPLTRSRLV